MQFTGWRRIVSWLLIYTTVCLPVMTAPSAAQAYQYDSLTGTYYVNARNYDPNTGRWMQQDPNGTGLILVHPAAYYGQSPSIGPDINPSSQHIDGLHLYQYVMGNPVNHTDPSGLFLYLGQLNAAAARAEAQAIGLAATNPAAMHFVGGLIAAWHLHMFATDREIQAITVAQPGFGGLINAELAMIRSSISTVLRASGAISALKTAQSATLRLVSTARNYVSSLFARSGTRVITSTIGIEINLAKIRIPGPLNSELGKLDYLLGRSTKSDPGKTNFFKNMMRFDDASLKEALKKHLVDNLESAIVQGSTPQGNPKILVSGIMEGANGQFHHARSVWQLNGDAAELITAFPGS